MSKKVQNLFVLLTLLLINTWLASHVTIQNTDIDRFFPTQEITQNDFSLMDYRFIFINTETDKLEALTEQGQLDFYLSLYDKPNTHLVFFQPQKQAELLSNFNQTQYLGTPIVGEILSTEFIKQTLNYLWLLILFIVPFIIWVSSLYYFVTLIKELLIFSTMVLSTIWLFEITLNPAYILSLLFTYLYAFITINQLHYNEISNDKLTISLFISILTTFLSGFLLSFSEFGIIKDFGFSLMIWLAALSLFTFSKLALSQRSPLNLTWFKAKSFNLSTRLLTSAILLLTAISIVPFFYPLETQFNSLIQSAQKPAIERFEATHSQAQPVLLAIKANQCNLIDYQCNQKLYLLEQKIQHEFPVKSTAITNLSIMYQQFTEQDFEQSSSASFAQFKLALEMIGNDRILYSADYSTTYQILSLSLLSPIAELAAAKTYIETLNEQQSDFTINLLGRFNDVSAYKDIFFIEMWQGIVIILLILIAGITLLYGNMKASISLLPAIFTLTLFTFTHWLFNLPFTIMSLVALILFVGLIADNIIHILMAYKTHYDSCFKVAFKPILLSNVILIGSLSLVFFIETGFLRIFGLELALLLGLHLILIVLLLPSLFKKTLPNPKNVDKH